MTKSSSAVRTRRTWERRQNGLILVSIELRHTEIVALTRMGLLAEADKDGSRSNRGRAGAVA